MVYTYSVFLLHSKTVLELYSFYRNVLMFCCQIMFVKYIDMGLHKILIQIVDFKFWLQALLDNDQNCCLILHITLHEHDVKEQICGHTCMRAHTHTQSNYPYIPNLETEKVIKFSGYFCFCFVSTFVNVHMLLSSPLIIASCT